MQEFTMGVYNQEQVNLAFEIPGPTASGSLRKLRDRAIAYLASLLPAGGT